MAKKNGNGQHHQPSVISCLSSPDPKRAIPVKQAREYHFSSSSETCNNACRGKCQITERQERKMR